ncbi:hypothetical protein T265_14284, partial [Opisthorchis viverrini]
TDVDEAYGTSSVTINVQGEVGENAHLKVSKTAEISTWQAESPDSSQNPEEPVDQALTYRCPICGRGFQHQSHLLRHQDSHATERFFKCNIQTLPSKHVDEAYGTSSVTINVQGEVGENAHLKVSKTAEISTWQAESPDSSQNPEEPVDQALTYRCPICGRGFQHQSHLLRHQDSHATERFFKCNMCSSTYKHQSDLAKHKRKRHVDEYVPRDKSTREQILASEQAGHPCLECGKQFKHWRNMKKHRRIVHPGTAGLVCEKCGMSFPRELHLNRHIRQVHERENKFPCPHCPQSLSYARTLMLHIRNMHKPEQADETPVGQQQGL